MSRSKNTSFISFNDLGPAKLEFSRAYESKAVERKTSSIPVYEGNDLEIGVLAKKLMKKDSITRIKALIEIQQILSERGQEIFEEFVPFFINCYIRSIVRDNSSKVREGFATTFSQLIQISRKFIRVRLQIYIGFLFLSTCESNSEIALLSQRSFDELVPDNQKKIALIIQNTPEFIVPLLKELLFDNTEETKAEGTEERQERGIICSINAMNKLILYCSDELYDTDAVASISIANVIQMKGFWKVLEHNSGSIRLACYQLIITLCKYNKSKEDNIYGKCVEVLCDYVSTKRLLLSEPIDVFVESAVVAWVSLVSTYSAIFWKSDSDNSVLIDKFIALLRDLLKKRLAVYSNWVTPIVCVLPKAYLTLSEYRSNTVIDIIGNLFDTVTLPQISISSSIVLHCSILEISSLLFSSVTKDLNLEIAGERVSRLLNYAIDSLNFSVKLGDNNRVQNGKDIKEPSKGMRKEVERMKSVAKKCFSKLVITANELDLSDGFLNIYCNSTFNFLFDELLSIKYVLPSDNETEKISKGSEGSVRLYLDYFHSVVSFLLTPYLESSDLCLKCTFIDRILCSLFDSFLRKCAEFGYKITCYDDKIYSMLSFLSAMEVISSINVFKMSIPNTAVGSINALSALRSDLEQKLCVFLITPNSFLSDEYVQLFASDLPLFSSPFNTLFDCIEYSYSAGSRDREIVESGKVYFHKLRTILLNTFQLSVVCSSILPIILSSLKYSMENMYQSGAIICISIYTAGIIENNEVYAGIDKTMLDQHLQSLAELNCNFLCEPVGDLHLIKYDRQFLIEVITWTVLYFTFTSNGQSLISIRAVFDHCRENSSLEGQLLASQIFMICFGNLRVIIHKMNESGISRMSYMLMSKECSDVSVLQYLWVLFNMEVVTMDLFYGQDSIKYVNSNGNKCFLPINLSDVVPSSMLRHQDDRSKCFNCLNTWSDMLVKVLLPFNSSLICTMSEEIPSKVGVSAELDCVIKRIQSSILSGIENHYKFSPVSKAKFLCKLCSIVIMCWEHQKLNFKSNNLEIFCAKDCREYDLNSNLYLYLQSLTKAHLLSFVDNFANNFSLCSDNCQQELCSLYSFISSWDECFTGINMVLSQLTSSNFVSTVSLNDFLLFSADEGIKRRFNFIAKLLSMFYELFKLESPGVLRTVSNCSKWFLSPVDSSNILHLLASWLLTYAHMNISISSIEDFAGSLSAKTKYSILQCICAKVVATLCCWEGFRDVNNVPPAIENSNDFLSRMFYNFLRLNAIAMNSVNVYTPVNCFEIIDSLLSPVGKSAEVKCLEDSFEFSRCSLNSSYQVLPQEWFSKCFYPNKCLANSVDFWDSNYEFYLGMHLYYLNQADITFYCENRLSSFSSDDFDFSGCNSTNSSKTIEDTAVSKGKIIMALRCKLVAVHIDDPKHPYFTIQINDENGVRDIQTEHYRLIAHIPSGNMSGVCEDKLLTISSIEDLSDLLGVDNGIMNSAIGLYFAYINSKKDALKGSEELEVSFSHFCTILSAMKEFVNSDEFFTTKFVDICSSIIRNIVISLISQTEDYFGSYGRVLTGSRLLRCLLMHESSNVWENANCKSISILSGNSLWIIEIVQKLKALHLLRNKASRLLLSNEMSKNLLFEEFRVFCSIQSTKALQYDANLQEFLVLNILPLIAKEIVGDFSKIKEKRISVNMSDEKLSLLLLYLRCFIQIQQGELLLVGLNPISKQASKEIQLLIEECFALCMTVLLSLNFMENNNLVQVILSHACYLVHCFILTCNDPVSSLTACLNLVFAEISEHSHVLLGRLIDIFNEYLPCVYDQLPVCKSSCASTLWFTILKLIDVIYSSDKYLMDNVLTGMTGDNFLEKLVSPGLFCILKTSMDKVELVERGSPIKQSLSNPTFTSGLNLEMLFGVWAVICTRIISLNRLIVKANLIRRFSLTKDISIVDTEVLYGDCRDYTMFSYLNTSDSIYERLSELRLGCLGYLKENFWFIKLIRCFVLLKSSGGLKSSSDEFGDEKIDIFSSEFFENLDFSNRNSSGKFNLNGFVRRILTYKFYDDAESDNNYVIDHVLVRNGVILPELAKSWTYFGLLNSRAKPITFEKQWALYMMSYNAIFLTISALPMMFRQFWIEDCTRTLGKRASISLQKFVEKYSFPALVEREMCYLEMGKKLSEISSVKGGDGFEDTAEMTIISKRSVGEITAVYVRDENKLELKLSLPASYPLRNVEVEVSSSMGINETRWKRWKLQIIQMLVKGGEHDNSSNVDDTGESIIEAIQIWKSNIDKEFEGVEPCPICYCVIHVKSNEMPKMECRTCKNKFHSTCLQSWFQSSGKSKCVICQQPFFD